MASETLRPTGGRLGQFWRSGIAQALYVGAAGLCGAGIIHIVVLLLLPVLNDRDAWSRLAANTELYQVISADGEAVLEAPDPLFRAAVCRFDLRDGAVRVQGGGSVPFWSVSIYNRAGDNVYNFNDHTAEGGVLDFVVVTPAQMIDMRKDLPADLQSSIFVETDLDEGMAVVRSFMPDESWSGVIEAQVASITCAPQ